MKVNASKIIKNAFGKYAYSIEAFLSSPIMLFIIILPGKASERTRHIVTESRVTYGGK
jgi:hypothetical protein